MDYAEELLSKFPSQFDNMTITRTGISSEANDLALGIARCHSGGTGTHVQHIGQGITIAGHWPFHRQPCGSGGHSGFLITYPAQIESEPKAHTSKPTVQDKAFEKELDQMRADAAADAEHKPRHHLMNQSKSSLEFDDYPDL